MISTICENGYHTNCWVDDCECTECHFVCPKCDRKVKKLNDGVCAPCYRLEAKKQPPTGALCDDCGGPGAVRNPKTRKNIFRCVECHAKSGEPALQLPASVGAMTLSTCAHLPLEDKAHEFLIIRQSRARCRRCHQDAFYQKMKEVNIVGQASTYNHDDFKDADVVLEEL